MSPRAAGRAVQGPGTALDPATRRRFQGQLGHDLRRVRVHSGPEAAESARAVGANAFTIGNHIVFGAGRYAPDSPSGRRLLAHELVHVVQQGPAAPGAGPALDVSRPEDAAEREADRLGDDLAAGRRAAVVEQRCDLSVQREVITGGTTAEREYVAEGVTRAFADIGTVLGLMNSMPPTDLVKDALWLMFRSDSPRTAGLVRNNLHAIRNNVNRAEYRCVRPPEPAARKCSRTTYGFVSDGVIFMCMPTFSDLGVFDQARGVTHEAAHRFLGLGDTGYFSLPGCEETAHPPGGPVRPAQQDKDSGTEGDNPAFRLDNADSYACFVHLLVHSRLALHTRAEGFRGADIAIRGDEHRLQNDVIYSQMLSDPGFRVAGVPRNSGFRFRWTLGVGGTQFRMDSPAGSDASAFDERNTAVFVPQSLRAILASRGAAPGAVTCEVELFAPFGDRYGPPIVIKQLPIRFEIGPNPEDI